jgi:hypothetical protein
MGMFDSIYVSKSLIDDLIKDKDVILDTFEGYYDFQTKDLDNSLTAFYIEEDGSFCWKKLNQEYIPPSEADEKKNRFNFGDWREISPPEKIVDTRSVYISFYDFFNTPEERCFITFAAHVKNGKLVEPIIIESIERTNLEEEAIKTKKWQAKWDNVRSSVEWRMADKMQNAKCKIRKIIYPISNFFDKWENNLRKAAKSKFLDEKDIGNW